MIVTLGFRTIRQKREVIIKRKSFYLANDDNGLFLVCKIIMHTFNYARSSEFHKKTFDILVHKMHFILGIQCLALVSNFGDILSVIRSFTTLQLLKRISITISSNAKLEYF